MLESEVEKHILENQGNRCVDEFRQNILTKFQSLVNIPYQVIFYVTRGHHASHTTPQKAHTFHDHKNPNAFQEFALKPACFFDKEVYKA
jgi:hypothetical protein